MPATPPLRSWVLPDEPAPVRLMSTIWPGADGIHDDLAGPADLDAWLNAVGIDRHGARATEDELRSAIRLRDAVRRLADRGDQLRACHAPGCVLYFVKSHPRREWCSVACGNRARAARHYDKIREGRAGSRPR